MAAYSEWESYWVIHMSAFARLGSTLGVMSTVTCSACGVVLVGPGGSVTQKASCGLRVRVFGLPLQQPRRDDTRE